MKIGFLTSYRATKTYGKEYFLLVKYLEEKGHEVVHSLNMTLDTLLIHTYPQREKIFHDHFKRLEACDVVIAECSLQSTQVGFGISYIREKGKPIIILSEKGSQGYYSPAGDVYSELENMIVTEYEKGKILSTIEYALSFMSERLDKRYTMILPSSLMARLETISKKKKLPKAVYIRQLLEKSLADENK